jgi:hypothetical protein
MLWADPYEELRASFTEDDTDAARAMLDTCRNRMSGRELEVCERIASTVQEDFDDFNLTGNDLRWFESLKTQFAREIAQWKDGVPA